METTKAVAKNQNVEFCDKLLQAIKKDDIKTFKGCMDETNCGTLRLGRFPVLSVMYLYKSRRLLRAHEKNFLRYTSWSDIGEPLELAAKFRAIAGKCLRIYLNETVSPVEMLLMLGRDWKLKRVFSKVRVVPPIKQRLKDIYFIKWGLKAEFVRDTIVLERRPLTHAEKMQWLTRALCVAMCAVLIVSTPFVINVFAPFIPSHGVINVAKLEQIRFRSDKTYALTGDVTLPSDFYVKEMNCELRGNGHTVTVNGNGVIGKLNGTLSDITFNTNGCAVVDTVKNNATQDNPTAYGTINNVTVNATVDIQTGGACGFVANTNYGEISNVTVNVSGSLMANLIDEPSFQCVGIVGTNYALIKDCTANYNNFTLQGQTEADAAFGGIVGLNENWVEGCNTTGAISADVLDVAGICAENNYVLRSNVNAVDVTQRADVLGWNPLAVGIVITNKYAVETCENRGAISSTSTATGQTDDKGAPSAYAAGIVYQNISDKHKAYLLDCVNNGSITATATEIDASAVGICNVSYGGIQGCVNNGAISVNGNGLMYAGGIVGLAYGYAYLCVNKGRVSASGQGEARVGGVIGASCAQILQCMSLGQLHVASAKYAVGGILGYAIGYGDSMSLFFGRVEQCVADCQISVTGNFSNDGLLAVGGIVGVMEEEIDGKGNYVGGAVLESYFTGNLQTPSGAYVGAIAGVVGKNIYAESADDNEKGNLYGNKYLSGCGIGTAFGAAKNDDNYQAVVNRGAKVTTSAALQNDSTYKSILKLFEK